jgi:hypothetical protein
LLADGGFLTWGAATYRASHDTYGTLASVSAIGEGIGTEVPAFEFVFNIPEGVSGGNVTQPGSQKSRVRLWLAEYVPSTGLISGSPDLLFDGQVDQMSWVGFRHELHVTATSQAERLLLRNTGNTLNPAFHKSVWSGEKGHDNAIGLTVPIAWGVESPGAQTTSNMVSTPIGPLPVG